MLTWSRSGHRPRAAAAVVACLLLAVAVTAPASAMAPASLVLPFDGEGGEVQVTPTALRAPDGTAEVDVALGPDAPGDVIVQPRLVTPDVGRDGTVAIGDGPAPGTVGRGSRLRPGERLRVTVAGLEVPTLVVIDVTAPDGTPASAMPAALVLPGPVGDPPSVALRTADDQVEATVTSDAPLLVSAAVRGASATVHPDRLVLPDAPVVLLGPAARWPLPAEVVVTDERGRTVTASTGTAPLVGVALTLLLAAVVGLAAVRRRGRSADELSA